MTQEQPTAAPILEAISQQSVPEGKPWLALNAQIMADMLRLDEALAKTGEKLDPGIYEFSLTPSPPLENSSFVQVAHRNNVLDFVPDDTAALLQSLWAPLDHLELVRSPTTADLELHAEERLHGRRQKDRRDELATYADNAHKLSAAMLEAGMVREAFRIAYRADLATFEVFCFDLAAQYGDTKLATIDVRMELAKVTLRSIQPTADFTASRNSIRGALVWSSLSPELIPWLS
ncbi:hypothetical protein GCM10025867_47350 (plasmid) [Frondihabitans sucicola]|uniref:Uncharacterized protein n=2 Tax=Frondihabitans sucicola TaxID=1268041 RepID=A0ABM8GVJ8_9MICO|nr:hypothetical protein GCM10025867_47350 [Frondihabitans sucicola]